MLKHIYFNFIKLPFSNSSKPIPKEIIIEPHSLHEGEDKGNTSPNAQMQIIKGNKM